MNETTALIEKEVIDLDVTYSEKCKICAKIPEDIRDKLQEDYQAGFNSTQLCDKYNALLEEQGVEERINPQNIYSHFKNHFDLGNLQDSQAVKIAQTEILTELAIKDDDGGVNGKNVIEIIEEGSTEIKPLSKGLLKSKALRLSKLYEQLAHDEALSGGMQNIKIHDRIQATEDALFKIAATLARDFYMDKSGKYDKTLFLIQDIARRIFIVLQEKEMRCNGHPEKIETMKEVVELLAQLFDEYEKEVDTIKPE